MGVTKKRRDTVFTHAHRKHIHIHAHVDTRRKLTGKPWIKEASRTVSSLPYYCNASIFFFLFFFFSFFFLSGISRANSLLSRVSFALEVSYCILLLYLPERMASRRRPSRAILWNFDIPPLPQSNNSLSWNQWKEWIVIIEITSSSRYFFFFFLLLLK